jgi:squalene synthase HpnC
MLRLVLTPRPHHDAAHAHAEHVPVGGVPGSDGSRKWSLAESFDYCEDLVRRRYENFPVASRFVPAELRPYLYAIYAFARGADDFADDPRYAGRRAEALEAWQEQLERAFHGEAEHPVFVALRETVDRRDIPIPPLADIISGYRMDLSMRRYPTFESLRGYLRLAASPIAQLVLYLFDYRDPALHRYAEDVASALLLTHFLQDLPLDVARDRLYLPLEDLNHFGVREEDVFAHRMTAPFRDLMRYEVARTRALLQRGRPLVDRVGRDLAFELNLIWYGGMTLLDQIDAADGDVFRSRPALGAVDQVRMAVRSAAIRT